MNQTLLYIFIFWLVVGPLAAYAYHVYCNVYIFYHAFKRKKHLMKHISFWYSIFPLAIICCLSGVWYSVQTKKKTAQFLDEHSSIALQQLRDKFNERFINEINQYKDDEQTKGDH